MIVCSCKGVSDREIRHHIESGCDSRKAVARACGAGSECGQCACDIVSLLEAKHQESGAGLGLALAPQSA